MNRSFPLVCAALLGLGGFADAQQVSASDKTSAADELNSSQFWIANMPTGQLIVQLGRIAAVARHYYVLDGACLVDEVSVVTTGTMPIKIYCLEPLSGGSALNAAKHVTERMQEWGSTIMGHVSTLDPNTTVAKQYPHTGCVEYRVASHADLDRVYESLVKSWQDGKGRTLKWKK